jgi:hypothetical protein
MGEGFLGRQPIEEKTASAQKVKEAAHTSRFWFLLKMSTKIFFFRFEFILSKGRFVYVYRPNEFSDEDSAPKVGKTYIFQIIYLHALHCIVSTNFVHTEHQSHVDSRKHRFKSSDKYAF